MDNELRRKVAELYIKAGKDTTYLCEGSKAHNFADQVIPIVREEVLKEVAKLENPYKFESSRWTGTDARAANYHIRRAEGWDRANRELIEALKGE